MQINKKISALNQRALIQRRRAVKKPKGHYIEKWDDVTQIWIGTPVLGVINGTKMVWNIFSRIENYSFFTIVKKHNTVTNDQVGQTNNNRSVNNDHLNNSWPNFQKLRCLKSLNFSKRNSQLAEELDREFKDINDKPNDLRDQSNSTDEFDEKTETINMIDIKDNCSKYEELSLQDIRLIYKKCQLYISEIKKIDYRLMCLKCVSTDEITY